MGLTASGPWSDVCDQIIWHTPMQDFTVDGIKETLLCHAGEDKYDCKGAVQNAMDTNDFTPPKRIPQQEQRE